MDVRFEPCGPEKLTEIVCCPGGLELSGKRFRGDLSETFTWRLRMIELGMRGLIASCEDGPRGFAEYMPAETAPLAIEAPGAAVLLCYHWAGTAADDPEHLACEQTLIDRVIAETRGAFTGLVTQGWDHENHFPIALLKELGFREVARRDQIALMWLPFRDDAVQPSYLPAARTPRNLASEGLLAIDAAFSARCPYSIDGEGRLQDAVATHPLAERIRLKLHRIDTREEALAHAVSPFDWAWIFFNGEEINLFEFRGERLAEEITRRIERLDPV